MVENCQQKISGSRFWFVVIPFPWGGDPGDPFRRAENAGGAGALWPAPEPVALGHDAHKGGSPPRVKRDPFYTVRFFPICHHVCIHVCHNVYVDMFTLLRHHVGIHLHLNVHGDCITFLFIDTWLSRLTSVCIRLYLLQCVFIYIYIGRDYIGHMNIKQNV